MGMLYYILNLDKKEYIGGVIKQTESDILFFHLLIDLLFERWNGDRIKTVNSYRISEYSDFNDIQKQMMKDMEIKRFYGYLDIVLKKKGKGHEPILQDFRS